MPHHAEGRHSVVSPDPRPRRGSFVALASLLAMLAVVAVSGAAWFGGYLAPLLDVAGPCVRLTKLVVIADSSIASGVSAVARKFDAASTKCVTTQVRSQQSADTATILASGADANADVWIPDSSVWLDRMAATAGSLGRVPPSIEAGKSIASTPVVFAAPATRAAAFGLQPISWAAVLGGTLDALLPDPEASSASLAGLFALRSRASTTDPRQFAGAVIALGKTIPRSPETAFASALAAEKPTVVITTERAVVAHNAADPAHPLVALYPTDGTTSLGYPFVWLRGAAKPQGAAPSSSVAPSPSTAPTDSSAKARLIDSFSAALSTAEDIFAGEGFRNGSGRGTLSFAGVIATPPASAVAADPAVQIEILRSWGVLTLRSRILTVIDVSGSMLDQAGSGLRRIDIFQKAAVGAMQKFSGEVELGVWIFSTNRVGTQPWEDLSPIAPLGDAAHLQQIGGIISSLPAQVRGDTGLYDTILAAVTRVRESYDPSKVNSVLLITDGRNDNPGGIDLATLLAGLKKMDDPLKRVPVIMIGFGPDTDQASMTQIARATGGAAYSANKPEDLGLVLVDALSQRTCRPNC